VNSDDFCCKQYIMKNILFLLFTLSILAACVPAKKYEDLLAKEQTCSEELAKFKASSLEYEGLAADYMARYEVNKKSIDGLKKDTTTLGKDLRILDLKYQKLLDEAVALETQFDFYRKSGEKATASLQADLIAKNLELQRKEVELNNLEEDLANKQRLLSEREQRVNELEEAIRKKDQAQNELKKRVADALIGFKNQGLTVEQKNGKIYVSLEAKLLFPSGSTVVAAEGQNALVELAKVLQTEKDLEIIVEGHTDTDRLSSNSHPKDNWELSVLRATSVVQIMLKSSTMNPEQLMAGGRSEFLPVDPDDKSKNRRIEIIISPNLNELFNIIGK
jgi:chemotaxis protein MotB